MYEPSLSLGILIVISPTGVTRDLSRYPLRLLPSSQSSSAWMSMISLTMPSRDFLARSVRSR